MIVCFKRLKILQQAADPISSITPTRLLIVLLHRSGFYLNPAAVWVLHTFGLSPYSLHQRRAASASYFQTCQISLYFTSCTNICS